MANKTPRCFYGDSWWLVNGRIQLASEDQKRSQIKKKIKQQRKKIH